MPGNTIWVRMGAVPSAVQWASVTEGSRLVKSTSSEIRLFAFHGEMFF
jgi:hypothetical protein